MADTDFDDNNVKIATSEVKSKNPVLVEGFPGIGLVGNIASQQIIDELKMEYIGSIDSRHFPPIAVLYEGLINMPVRIYESEEHNMVIIVSDIPINPVVAYDVSKALLEWAESINVKEVVSLAGIATMSDENKVFGAATNNEMLDKIKDKVELFQMGTISGISGSIMAECLVRGIPAIGLLGSTMSQNPDPRAASVVIDVLNQLYDLGVDTETLLDQAEKIEIEMQRLAEDVRTTEQPTGTRKEFPMYG
ncbi:proteasome assembly chaperone family protein [Methanolobus sp. ZRKC3]|uniref:proteasome assembly chaperone family protein n=1 Tax=Methanolobus sp. ZRKC3 TaxID=3125786 RepID=UPI003255DEBC